MTSSPPTSPAAGPQRPMSALIRPPRSNSRMSVSSRPGGSRASDEEGKTAVKVAVRIRPPLRPSDPGFELIPQRFQRSMLQVTSPTSLSVDSPQGRKLFVFDKVFGEDVHQEGVWAYLAESVDAFVQGYNVSVLAYGQSGAGKSYTMGTSGPTEQSDPKQMGVIPRAAASLFEKLAGPPTLGRNGSGIRTPSRYSTNSVHTLQSLTKAADKNWQMKATYVEIYNEQLRDLLVPEHVPQGERGAVTIREDTKGRILPTGLHQVTINSIEDLLKALNTGSTIRQTDSTAINAKSSRSHAVFSLNLIQRKNKSQQTPTHEKRMSVPLEALTGGENWVTVDSKLHFVDLAGSERLKNTGASGERAREGISINAGLASLGKVISQLSSRQTGSHVSYRDSKLTRLLQDSLGGNAITYMIACVTPAEFHLSETLNTVQYAQRARAIQSRPQIQQISDDSDKQVTIDRLRAEVSFLREQLRKSEHEDRPGNAPQERSERQNEREVELQNHLLDIQENYSALSDRHFKLISEISKTRGVESGETPILNGAIGNSAVERLKRSNSFAEAVEQVVLEYEKTIQSLETSLSNTRSSLSTSESNLLERETKCAYVETFNQQLQTRIQKLIDRESSTEQYLHDLEAKLDGRTSGEEKNSVVMADLRKEIVRLRDHETTSEEYISTMEERLAEADLHVAQMQSELERLEHVVERQRSLGKLDNLLYELDHIQSNGKLSDEDHHATNGISKDRSMKRTKRQVLEATLKAAIATPIPESEEDEDHDGDNPPALSLYAKKQHQETYSQSPAQSKFVAEKLESVNQELFDLKVEHESTVDDLNLLSAKYDEALRTLAALQDAVDESRRPTTLLSGPPAFLEDARVTDLRNVGQSSSSRSLSSELSLATESQATSERSNEGTLTEEGEHHNLGHELSGISNQSQAMEELKALHMEREEAMAALQQQYSQLEEEHEETLDLVEELKAEVQKAMLTTPASPTSPVIRRKSSQNVMTIDRAHRSLASLGNIAGEYFENNPDAMQNFELNLHVVVSELHQRSERVVALEAELASVKKEMEVKMTIISGLTRERSSLKSPHSPMDMSMISAMRDQLLRSENQIAILHETYAAREKQLLEEIESLKAFGAAHRNSAMPGFFPETPATQVDAPRGYGLGEPDANEQKVRELEEELLHWQERHEAAIQRMEASKRHTVAELEASLASIEAMHEQNMAEYQERARSLSATVAAFEQERDMYTETAKALKREIADQKITIATNLAKVAELEQALAAADKDIEAANEFKAATHQQLTMHRDQIAMLEQQLIEHESAVEFHKHGLKSLHDSHTRNLEDARLSALRQAEADAKSSMEEIRSRHTEELKTHQDRAQDLERQLSEHEQALNEHKAALIDRNALIEKLQQDKAASQTATGGGDDAVEVARARLSAAEEAKAQAEASLATTQAKVEELTRGKQELNEQLVDLRDKEERARRLVEELEGQLSSTFEDSRATSGRLSLMQSTRDQELMEARAATVRAQEEIATLSQRLDQFEGMRGSPTPTDGHPLNDRSSSTVPANLRKSASVTSLPSPPPAIPLPPLPITAPNTISPTGATHGHSPQGSKDLISSQHAADQEARIRTIEKHLFAEKQLTATLEEALGDLESQGNKVKADMELWKKKAWAYEDELNQLRKEKNSNRYSLQAVEEERTARKRAEAAKATLEERMALMNNSKKKKSQFNCF